MNITRIIYGIVSICTIVLSGYAQSVIPIPITAEKAFDSWAHQIDPASGVAAGVALVDVRSVSEYFWVGAAAKVDKITTVYNRDMVPDNGKTILFAGGHALKFKCNGRQVYFPVRYIEKITTSPISINIPYKKWDEESKSLILNDQFTQQIEDLATQYNVLILYCRSGGRSGDCVGNFNTDLFDAIYEIDQPDGANGFGGFEGPGYNDSYNGYLGFPQRPTCFKEHPSVSWKDAGLPIHVGWK